MEVYIRHENKKISVEKVETVKALLEKLGFRREEVLVIDMKEQRLLLETEKLNPNQQIEIRKVISGG